MPKLMQSCRDYWRCLWQAVINSINHDGIEHAGYLAFVGLLSLFPFLVLLMTFAGMLGEHEVGRAFVQLLFDRFPERVTTALMPRIDEIVGGPPQGILTLAIVGATWTASSSVEGLKTILNRAYRVHTPPAYPLRRAWSIVQLFIIMVIVITGMLGLVFVPIGLSWLEGVLHITITFKFKALSWVLTVIAMWLAVASVYYFIPNLQQRFRYTLPGAFAAVLLWAFSAWILSFYLSQFPLVSIIYGSLGGIIAALLFFYMVALAVIYGAEFNYLLEERRGHEHRVRNPAGQQPSKTNRKPVRKKKRR